MKINFYGCSFSDGGGMDRWDWFEGVKDEDWVDPTWRETVSYTHLTLPTTPYV